MLVSDESDATRSNKVSWQASFIEIQDIDSIYWCHSFTWSHLTGILTLVQVNGSRSPELVTKSIRSFAWVHKPSSQRCNLLLVRRASRESRYRAARLSKGIASINWTDQRKEHRNNNQYNSVRAECPAHPQKIWKIPDDVFGTHTMLNLLGLRFNNWRIVTNSGTNKRLEVVLCGCCE